MVNRLGRQMATLGITAPVLEQDRLIRQAINKTGLSDFGEESFRDGLEMLTRSLAEQAQLSQVGRFAAHFNLLDHLCVRLRLIEFRKRHAGVVEQKIQRPIFILGLPRTGTTILYELLAQDQAIRSPATWEVARPIPPAVPETRARDGRIRSMARLLGLAEKLSPGFQAIHAIGAELPQECVYILASNFYSEQFGYMYNIPRYRAWLLEQDMTESYRWHYHFLQHMQYGDGRERWVLKAPAHLAYLHCLLARYPDACVVWTHRQPADALASFSSLVSRLQSGFSEVVNPKTVGSHETGHFSTIVDRAVQQRSMLDAGQFYDVRFSDICTDPIAVVKAIYHHFGMKLSSEAESRMCHYISAHPRYAHGKHRYTHEEFGIGDSTVQELFSGYLSRYGDYLN
jgi:hypothetical protein